MTKKTTVFGAVLAASLLALGAGAHAAAPHGDIDHDGVQNRYDHDRDNDGLRNARDPHPNRRDVVRYVHVERRHHVNPMSPRGDLDRDGIQNRRDRDIDGDRVPNFRDRFPYNRHRS